MMSDDMLSQDEIDALLRGSDSEDASPDAEPSISVDDFLSSLEQDALGEIGNISFGSAATALSTLLNQKVDITTPEVAVIHRHELEQEFPQPYVAIKVSYTEGFSGANVFVIKTTDAGIIADLMLGGDGTAPASELSEIHLSAVQEAMNQMMGSAATSMSTIFNKRVDISPPSIDILNLQDGEGTEQLPEEEQLLKVSFRLKVGQLIDSSLMQLQPLAFSKDLVEELLNPPEEVAPPQQQQVSQPALEPQRQPVVEQMVQEPEPQFAYANQAAMPQQQAQQPTNMYQGEMRNVQPAAFSDFAPASNEQANPNNLNMLLDIPLQVTVELGKTKRTVQDILEMSPGSIVELDKLAGEPVDILVNNKLIAKGEVVVIDENFGVRVTDIVSQTDRLLKLQ